MIIDVDAAGTVWLSWAKERLAELTLLREYLGLPKLVRYYIPAASVTVIVVSSRFRDIIRITAGGHPILCRISSAEYALFSWEMDLKKRILAYEESPPGTVIRDFSFGGWNFLACSGGILIMDKSDPTTDKNYWRVNPQKLNTIETIPWSDIETQSSESGPVGVKGKWSRNGKAQFLYAGQPFNGDDFKIGYASPAVRDITYGTTVTNLINGTHSRSGFGGQVFISPVDSYVRYNVITGARTAGSWASGTSHEFEPVANSDLLFKPLASAQIEVRTLADAEVTTFDLYANTGTYSWLSLACDDENLLAMVFDDDTSKIVAKHYAITQNPVTLIWSFTPTDLSAKIDTMLTDLGLAHATFRDYNQFAGSPFSILPVLRNDFKHPIAP